MGASVHAYSEPDPPIESQETLSEERPPSSVAPAFQVAAVASLAGLRDSRGNVPLDACVLVRTSTDVPPGLSSCRERVLLHVDGMLSLQDIATKTKVSLPDAIEAYLELLGLGLVDAREPISGTFCRHDIPVLEEER